MTRLQTQAAALAATCLAILAALVFVPRWIEPKRADAPQEPPAASDAKPEPPDQRALRDAARPRPVPDRVILTWQGDPATTQAVTWRTGTPVPRAVAQIAPVDPGPGVEPGWKDYDAKKVGTFAAHTELLKTAINEAHYHSVNFEGLLPAT